MQYILTEEKKKITHFRFIADCVQRVSTVMTTATGRTQCVTCGKEKATFKCGECSQEFCYNHLTDHKQDLNKQFDQVEVNRDLFRQTLTEHVSKPQQHPLIQQIDRWERNSITVIRQTADEARQTVLEETPHCTRFPCHNTIV